MQISKYSTLTQAQCHRARLSRDQRFDGVFYTAVKTTGIFCRPICPANPPLEKNVAYYSSFVEALQSGFRPCLRCRPDSAPHSPAWHGVETTFKRATHMIDQGALQDSNLPELSSRLGISNRYLRTLFQRYLGMPPKQYANYQQLMFAKQLLHSSTMSIGDIAFASGYNSVRRFNDAFKETLQLTPSELRRTGSTDHNQNHVHKAQQLTLGFRLPFNWQHLLAIYKIRAIQGIEAVDDESYQRNFRIDDARGWFKATLSKQNTLLVDFDIDDLRQLRSMVRQVRRLFDLDADIETITSHLNQTQIAPLMGTGIRIPGVWSTWEAGVRAIFGQQVSVKAAISMLNTLVAHVNRNNQETWYFPEPPEIATLDLGFFKMPQSRKDTLTRFARHMVEHPASAPETWIALKGIGPWTVSYANLRGISKPDCFLSTDLVVKKAIHSLGIPKEATNTIIDEVSPWGSYATFNCWNATI